MQTIRTETGYQLDKLHVDAKPYSNLPTQQARTLLFVAKGMSQKSIAKAMGVGCASVKQACSNLSYKFNTHSMRETVNSALEKGVLRYSLCIMLCVLSAINSDVERSFRVVRVNRAVRTSKASRRLKRLQIDLLTA